MEEPHGRHGGFTSRVGLRVTFYLTAYAARSCPLKTAFDFDPALEKPTHERLTPSFFHDADAIELDVFTQVAAAVPRHVDLRTMRGEPSGVKEAATLSAMADGMDAIIMPMLPRDEAAHRAGSPSLLIKFPDGYVPVQVKFHRVFEQSHDEDSELHYSILAAPTKILVDTGRRFRWESRLTAALQVGHYWRLLEPTGFAAKNPRAGVIGIERVAPQASSSRRQHLAITWLDLTKQCVQTDPPGDGDQTSTLQRYDEEFAERVALAERAVSGKPCELTPIIARECSFCDWQEHCAALLDPDDVSVQITKSALDRHEIAVLRKLGITTIAHLAAADLDALVAQYVPAVTHRDGGEERLRLAARRARMLVDGVLLERVSDQAIHLPEHDLEIDLDIETSAEDTVYLWGFWVHDRASGEQYYHAISSFTELTPGAELELALEAFAWLEKVTHERDAAVYHYSDYETIRINRLAARVDPDGDDEAYASWVTAFATAHFVDLFPLVKDLFFGASGLGLKMVANAGPGFAWRDESPGGLNSQTWFAEAVQGKTHAEREAARTRVLEYNEDDVRATWHVRHWLRTL